MNPISKIKAFTRGACAFSFAICAAVNTLNAFTVTGNLVLNGDAETGNLDEWTMASGMNAKDSGIVAGLEPGRVLETFPSRQCSTLSRFINLARIPPTNFLSDSSSTTAKPIRDASKT